jgi:hypothetical protein
MGLDLVQQMIDGRRRVGVMEQILPAQVGQAAQGLKGMSVPQQRNAYQIQRDGNQLLLDFRQQSVSA